MHAALCLCTRCYATTWLRYGLEESTLLLKPAHLFCNLNLKPTVVLCSYWLYEVQNWHIRKLKSSGDWGVKTSHDSESLSISGVLTPEHDAHLQDIEISKVIRWFCGFKSKEPTLTFIPEKLISNSKIVHSGWPIIFWKTMYINLSLPNFMDSLWLKIM